jgi:glycerophosphoryl diester phosphodiesterase
LLLSAIDGWLAPAPDPARVAWLGRHEYAHRGVHDAQVPENSSAAFAEAIARGMGIECDVQKSRDGRAMVFHDWGLGRLTNTTGPVAARDAAKLTKLALLGTENCIPLLEELLDQVAGRVPLLIEVKARRQTNPVRLCRAVRRALEGYQGDVAVMSFDPRVPKWFAGRAPNIVRGLVVTEEEARGPRGRLSRHLALWHARPDFLAYDVRDLPSRFAAAQRARGLPLLSWTVRAPELREVAALHADAPIAEGAGLA